MNEGIPYFPLGTHLNNKTELITAEFGELGFAVIIRLYQHIYGGEGYFCEWNDDDLMLFCHNYAFEREFVKKVVKTAVKRGIFDSNNYNKNKVLTSAAIQSRYLSAVSRRKSVILQQKYILINIDEKFRNISIIDENACILTLSEYLYQQGKENTTTENSDKEKRNTTPPPQTNLKDVIHEYERYIGTLRYEHTKALDEWINKTEKAVVMRAIHEAADNNIHSWNYIEAILKHHYNAGRTTVEEINNNTEEFKKHRKQPDTDASVYTVRKNDIDIYKKAENMLNSTI